MGGCKGAWHRCDVKNMYRFISIILQLFRYIAIVIVIVPVAIAIIFATISIIVCYHYEVIIQVIIIMLYLRYLNYGLKMIHHPDKLVQDFFHQPPRMTSKNNDTKIETG